MIRQAKLIFTWNADVVAKHEPSGGRHYTRDDDDGRDLRLELLPGRTGR